MQCATRPSGYRQVRVVWGLRSGGVEAREGTLEDLDRMHKQHRRLAAVLHRMHDVLVEHERREGARHAEAHAHRTRALRLEKRYQRLQLTILNQAVPDKSIALDAGRHCLCCHN